MGRSLRSTVSRRTIAEALVVAAVTAAVATACAPARAQAKYRVVRLGALAPDQHTGGFAVNDLGHVVGTSGNSTVGHQAFHWSDANNDGAFQQSEMTALGTFGGASSSAEAINGANVVVGSAYPPPGPDGTQDVRAFVWKPGDAALTDLNTRIDPAGVPAGESWVLRQAHDINDGGVIVARGWHTVPDGLGGTTTTDQACVLTPTGGGLYAVTGLGIGRSSRGGLSSTGLAVVGESTRSYFWDGAAGTPATQLPIVGSAEAVNAGGTVTGQTYFDDRPRAFVLDGPAGTAVSLGTLAGGSGSHGWDINDAGTVVGRSSIGRKAGTIIDHAFRWQAGTGMVDLNSLITLPKGARWYLIAAYGVSPSGLICGTSGGDNGFNRAYLLIPQP